MKTKNGLTIEQELFCKLYASEREFFGCGVESYAEAYHLNKSKKGWYNTAKSCASKLLTKANIIKRINELLATGGYNSQNIDKQLLFVINQFSDLSAKLGAIKEYNKLKQRITDKAEVSTNHSVIIHRPGTGKGVVNI